MATFNTNHASSTVAVPAISALHRAPRDKAIVIYRDLVVKQASSRKIQIRVLNNQIRFVIFRKIEASRWNEWSYGAIHFLEVTVKALIATGGWLRLLISSHPVRRRDAGADM